MPAPNLLDLLGVWPTVEKIVEFCRKWKRFDQQVDFEMRVLEAAAREADAKARQATAEATINEVQAINDVMKLAEKCGLAAGPTTDEEVKMALASLVDKIQRG